MDRSKALLEILRTRKNGYKLLVQGLRKYRQTGALGILNEPIQVESNQHDTAGLSLSHND